MNGLPISRLNDGFRDFVYRMRKDPLLLEVLYLSVVTFDNTAKEVLPLSDLTGIIDNQLLTCPRSGGAMLGEGLEMVIRKVGCEVKQWTDNAKSDWLPILFVILDGKASDQQTVQLCVEPLLACGLKKIFSFAYGPKADETILRRFSNFVFKTGYDNGGNVFRYCFQLCQNILGAKIEAPLSTGDAWDEDLLFNIPESTAIQLVHIKQI